MKASKQQGTLVDPIGAEAAPITSSSQVAAPGETARYGNLAAQDEFRQRESSDGNGGHAQAAPSGAPAAPNSAAPPAPPDDGGGVLPPQVAPPATTLGGGEGSSGQGNEGGGVPGAALGLSGFDASQLGGTLDCPMAALEGGSGAGTIILDAIRDASEHGREQLLETLESAIDQVIEAFTQLSGAAGERAEGAVEAGAAAFNASGEALHGIPEARSEALTGAANAASEDASGWVESAKGDVEALFTDKQTEAVNLGQTEANATRDSVNFSVGDAEGAIACDIGEAQAIGERAATGGDERTAAARAASAREVAGDTVVQLGDMKEDVSEFHGSGDDVAEEFVEQAAELGEQVADQSGPLADQIETLGSDADNVLHSAAEHAKAALADAVSSGRDALSEGRLEWSEGLGGATTELQERLAEQAQVATETLRKAATDVATGGDDALGEIAGQLQDVTLEEEEAEALAQGASNAVSDAYSNAAVEVGAGVSGHADVITGLGSEIDAAYGEQEIALRTGLDGIVGGIDGDADAAVDEVGAGLRDSVVAFTDAGDTMITEVGDDVDLRMNDVRTEFGDRRTEIETTVSEGIAPPVQDSHDAVRSLPDRIATAQLRAEQKTSQGWLSGQLTDLRNLIFDPGFLAAVVVGLLLTAAAIFLLPAELSLLAIIGVAALIGAISCGVGAIVSNVWNNRPWYSGLGEALLVGALLGGLAALIIEAIGVGIAGLAVISLFGGLSGIILNVLHREPWDKNLLANMLLAPLLLLIGKALGGRLRPGRGGTTEEPTSTKGQPRIEEPTPVEEQTGPRGGSCFIPGTPVHTPAGPIPIEALRAGGRVLVRLGDAVENAEIVSTFVREVPEIFTIATGGDVVHCSGEHPFYVEHRGWVQARALCVGDALRTLDGALTPIASIVRAETHQIVHNIEVSGRHAYHVGESGILVHNKSMRASQSLRASNLKAQAEELPPETHGRQQMIDEAEAIRTEADALEHTSKEPSAALDQRLQALEQRIELAELPGRTESLVTDAEALKARADALPIEEPMRWQQIQQADELLGNAKALRDLANSGEADPSLLDEYWSLRRQLTGLDRNVTEIEPAPPAEATVLEQRLARAKWSPHDAKHMKATSEAQARRMTTPSDTQPDPPSQYLPDVNNQALELEALQNGTVIRGNPNDPGSTVHVRYDAGRVIGYDGGEPTTTMRAELTAGDVYHGHPRRF